MAGQEAGKFITGANALIKFGERTLAYCTDVSYTVSAGDLIRLDPSGWAFAGAGYLRITSNGTEAADRTIELHLRRS